MDPASFLLGAGVMVGIAVMAVGMAALVYHHSTGPGKGAPSGVKHHESPLPSETERLAPAPKAGTARRRVPAPAPAPEAPEAATPPPKTMHGRPINFQRGLPKLTGAHGRSPTWRTRVVSKSSSPPPEDATPPQPRKRPSGTSRAVFATPVEDPPLPFGRSDDGPPPRTTPSPGVTPPSSRHASPPGIPRTVAKETGVVRHCNSQFGFIIRNTSVLPSGADGSTAHQESHSVFFSAQNVTANLALRRGDVVEYRVYYGRPKPNSKAKPKPKALDVMLLSRAGVATTHGSKKMASSGELQWQRPASDPAEKRPRRCSLPMAAMSPSRVATMEDVGTDVSQLQQELEADVLVLTHPAVEAEAEAPATPPKPLAAVVKEGVPTKISEAPMSPSGTERSKRWRRNSLPDSLIAFVGKDGDKAPPSPGMSGNWRAKLVSPAASPVAHGAPHK